MREDSNATYFVDGRASGDSRSDGVQSGNDKTVVRSSASAAHWATHIDNRYVDGLATWQPRDPEIYREIGQQTSKLGYVGRDYKKPLEAIAAKGERLKG